MNTDEVTAIILSLPGATRSLQSEAPDFRVAGKIFATLPSERYLVLKLTADQQEMVLTSEPAVFSPVEGGWGARGWTNAEIARLDEASALAALIMAWTNAAPENQNGRGPSPKARRKGD